MGKVDTQFEQMVYAGSNISASTYCNYALSPGKLEKRKNREWTKYIPNNMKRIQVHYDVCPQGCYRMRISFMRE